MGLPKTSASPSQGSSPSRRQISLVPKLTGRKPVKTWLLIGAAALLTVLAITTLILSQKWPFTRERVVKDLEQATSSTVEIKNFQQTYFPYPGCIAESLTFRRTQDAGIPPLVTIRRLIVLGSYTGLLSKHISVLRAEGLRIIVPPLGAASGPQNKSSQNKAVIGQMVTYDALLEFTSRDPNKAPVRFAIHHFNLQNWGSGGPMAFRTALLNPTPPGEIVDHGTLGPWAAAQTPVTGEYSFRRADLGVFKSIAGVLSSDGKFQGTIRNLNVQGATDVPAFEVTRNHHRVRLTTQFRALVNGTNGDVVLQEVNAHFWNTAVTSQGTILGRTGEKGKTASLNLMVRQGRIQDLLLLIVRSPKAPLSGVVSLRANATIPPGQKSFLKKLQLQGDFGIDDALNNNRSRAPFPISITGTYHHASYHVSSSPQKENQKAKKTPSASHGQ